MADGTVGIQRPTDNRIVTVILITALLPQQNLAFRLYLAKGTQALLFISSRPGEIVLDHLVDIPRPRIPESEDIELLRLELLKKNP